MLVTSYASFAIVCASKSCPKLVNASYEAASLESQLDQAARDFLSDTSRNKIATDQVFPINTTECIRDIYSLLGKISNQKIYYSEVNRTSCPLG